MQFERIRHPGSCMSRLIDTRHNGRERVIGAWETRGLIIDPGPESTIGALLDGLGDTEPRALLLTHIHLDHAGAAGALVGRFPQLRVYVSKVGAPHLIDPAKLLRSAARLYGGEEGLRRTWGEVLPVPEASVTALEGGERIEGMEVLYTPGHARHHLSYLDPDCGAAFVGDVAGVRIEPSRLIIMPTPPPEIDVEAWLESIEALVAAAPKTLHLTHYGAVADPVEHLRSAAERLRVMLERAAGGRQAFMDGLEADLAAVDRAQSSRYAHATPRDHLWLGLERYLDRSSR